jgi:hypothetical protein
MHFDPYHSLRDRKKRLIGILKFDNRKRDGEADAGEFDAWDKAIGVLLATQISTVLESLLVFDTFRSLMSNLYTAKEFKDMLDAILEKALRLTRAARGDFAWRSLSTDRLRVLVQRPMSLVSDNAELPEKSLAQTVYTRGERIIIPDVRQVTDYVWFDQRCRSAVSIPVELPRRALGALTVESFQLAAFDEHDVNILQSLGQIATVASQLYGDTVTQGRGLLTRAGGKAAAAAYQVQPDAIQATLLPLQEKIRTDLEMEGCVIYLADESSQMLRAVAYSGEKPEPRQFARFGYGLNETSFATTIYNSQKSLHVEDPFTDEPIVAAEGRKMFGVAGPLFGVLLLLGGRRLGVLVAWKSSGEIITGNELPTMERFAPTAAAALAGLASRLPVWVLGLVQEVLIGMQSTSNTGEIVRMILETLTRRNFDRVRAFELRLRDECFVCLDSYGVEPPGVYAGYSIALRSSPHAQELFYGAHINRKAKVFQPVHGYEPHAMALGKREDLAWASVPIFTGGRLHGYLSGDNSRTGRIGSAQESDNLSERQAFSKQGFVASLRG